MARLIHAGHGPRSVILIRLLVGAVFLAEGIQKFLFPAALGVGRFVKIGLPAPEVLAGLAGWAWTHGAAKAFHEAGPLYLQPSWAERRARP